MRAVRLLLIALAALSCRATEPGHDGGALPSRATSAPGDAGPRALPPSTRPTMQNDAHARNALAQISDATLLEAPAMDLVARGYAGLGFDPFEGLVLRAPAQVDMAAHGRVPLLLALGQTAARAARVPLPANAAFLVVRAGAGERWAVPAFPPPEGKIPVPDGKAPVPPPMNPTMEVASVEHRDLRANGAVPWEPGRYVVRVLDWDRVSNPVTITLAGAPAAPRRVVVASAVTAGGGPALEGMGAAVAVPAGPLPVGSAVPVQATVRLAADPGWPATAEGATVMPVTLVLARLGVLRPVLIDLFLPVKPGPTAEAQFTGDLQKLAPAPLAAGEYRVWLLSGEALSAPAPLTIAR